MPTQDTPLTYDALLEHLISKNLVVFDDNRAKKYLRTIGYTRFKTYFKMFCNSQGQFENSFSFDDLLNIYVFDRQLRTLFIEALERIEIAIRNYIVDTVSVNTYDAYFIYDSNNFNSGYEDIFKKVKDNVWYQTDKKININDNQVCCWDIIKYLTFGCLSAFYDELKGNLRQDIADTFNLKNKVMSSWLLSLSASRNICAHYSLLWSRIFSIKPMNLKRDGELIIDFGASSDKLYAQFYIIAYFMLQISPTTSWIERVYNLIDEYCQKTHFINYDIMGFPENARDYQSFLNINM